MYAAEVNKKLTSAVGNHQVLTKDFCRASASGIWGLLICFIFSHIQLGPSERDFEINKIIELK